MTRRVKFKTWRYEVVSGQYNNGVSWVELREQSYDDNGEKLGYVSIAAAATIAELVADIREWLAVAERYAEQEQT